MVSDRTAIRTVLEALQDAGHEPVRVDYGDGDGVDVKGAVAAVKEVMEVDEAFVILQDGRWVRFVLGNGDPLDCIVDYTASLDGIIDPIMRRWGL